MVPDERGPALVAAAGASGQSLVGRDGRPVGCLQSPGRSRRSLVNPGAKSTPQLLRAWHKVQSPRSSGVVFQLTDSLSVCLVAKDLVQDRGEPFHWFKIVDRFDRSLEVHTDVGMHKDVAEAGERFERSHQVVGKPIVPREAADRLRVALEAIAPAGGELDRRGPRLRGPRHRHLFTGDVAGGSLLTRTWRDDDRVV